MLDSHAMNTMIPRLIAATVGASRRTATTAALAFVLVCGTASSDAAAETAAADDWREDAAADAARRPRIGLALGGGAARGAAHVGVLQVLEQMRIPVDYIAGTSMGAVIGAMYALGVSATEIESTLLATDWEHLFSDRPDRRQRSIRRKQDDTSILLPLEFGIAGGKPALPPALVAGQKFAFAFDVPGLYTSGHDSFDNLPIPFRAVATDLQSGEMVVLDHGNLLRAVRASMSVPGAFPPVEIDGRLLVDGFVVRNVPVDVARAMGADVVIAVDVGHLPEDTKPDQLNSLSGVIAQMSIIHSRENVTPQLAAADVVIQVETRDLSGTEFTELADIIPRGQEAAEQSADALAPYAIDPEAYATHRRHVLAAERPSRTVPIVDDVLLDNRTRIDDQVLDHRITQPTGQPLDVARLERDLGRIYELGLMESVDFALEHGDQATALAVSAWEKPHAPLFLYFGLAYRRNYEGRSRLSITSRINLRELNRLGAEWRTDLAIGAEDAIWTEWYQPLSFHRSFFVAAHAGIRSVINPVFTDGYLIGTYRYHFSGIGLDAGVGLGRHTEVRIGPLWGYTRTEERSGDTGYPDLKEDYGAVDCRILVDMFDDHQIPRHGYGADLRLELSRPGIGADLRYDRVLGDFMAAASRGRHTMQVRLAGGSDLGSGLPYYRQYALGGVRQLSGYKDWELRGNVFALTDVGYLYRLKGTDFSFSSRWYVGAWFDVGNVWPTTGAVSFGDLRYCWAVSLLGDTVLGPVEFAYGRSNDGRDAFYLNIGIHLATPAND